MKNPDMKIRLAPELRSQIEASAKLNERTLNAEVAARLQWSFDGAYDAKAELRAVTDKALATIKASPAIRLEKLLIASENRLETKLQELEERISKLENGGRRTGG